MADVVFVNPDDLDAIVEKTGQPPIGAVRVVATQLVARGQVVGPLPDPSFVNLYSAAPAFEMAVDDGGIRWPMRPNLSQYIPRIDHGPRFVPKSHLSTVPQSAIWGCLGNGKRCRWRSARRAYIQLLDPNYVHPKRKRHG